MATFTETGSAGLAISGRGRDQIIIPHKPMFQIGEKAYFPCALLDCYLKQKITNHEYISGIDYYECELGWFSEKQLLSISSYTLRF